MADLVNKRQSRQSSGEAKKRLRLLFATMARRCSQLVGIIGSAALVAKERLRFWRDDVAAIRVVAKEHLKISADDAPSIRVLVNERLRLREDRVGILHRVLREGSSLVEEDIADMDAGVPLCYSQEGESLILERIFRAGPAGFYVDVGAHHPKRFSNTYSLYKRGWRGINLDPNPGVKELFATYRPRDTFISTAVSNREASRDFYVFSEPALNTFSRALADEYQQANQKLLEVRSITSRTLASILSECNVERPIDFMSIDVEGEELDVLQSNDWRRYRPALLLVEIIGFDLHRAELSRVHCFLIDLGYRLFAKTYNTVFYVDSTSTRSLG